MPEIPEPEKTTVKMIYKSHEKRVDKVRPYLGGSAIGDECARKLWFSFRFCGSETFDGRKLRLFQAGHRLESVMIEELRSIGCKVWDVDEDGKQFGVSHFEGHFRGHLDGVIVGIPEAPKTPHLLEIKSSNTKKFKQFQKEGLKKTNIQYYDQMIFYMGKKDLGRGLFMVTCKETLEIYTERIEFDQKRFDFILDKAEEIIFNNSLPEGISKDPTFFKCKWCNFNDICHNDAPPKKSCRNCMYGQADPSGIWSCLKTRKGLSVDEQIKGCTEYVINENFKPF